MRQAEHCCRCGRERGDGRRDRGWLYWVVDVHQRRGGILLGPINVPVALCATCWRTEVAPLFDDIMAEAAS